MRHPRSRWLMTLMLGSTLLITTAASAQTEGTPNPGGQAWRARMMARFQQELGLTDAQMQQIQAVHASQAANQKQLWKSLRQAQSDLRQLALNGGDATTLQAKEAQVAQLMSQGVAMRVQTLQQISPILTPEQRAKYAQMGPGMRWHHHRGGQTPPAS